MNENDIVIKIDPEVPVKPTYPTEYPGPTLDNDSQIPEEHTFATKYGYGRPVGGFVLPSGGAKSFGVKGQGNKDQDCTQSGSCIPIDGTDR